MISVVVLDSYALNPGDLSWDKLQEKASCTFYPRTKPEETAERIGNAQAVITNKVPVTAEIMDKCPDLKYIGVMATGYNIIDVEAAKKRNIVVTNVPAYSTNAVAQHVFALILDFYSCAHEYAQDVANGGWIKSPDFSYMLKPMTELYGKTLGIAGYGSIGSRVAKIGHAFGMNVICHTRTPSKIPVESDIKPVTKEELFSLSDILTIHCPLTDETKNMVNAQTLSLMKKNALLINTARGPVVDEDALEKALKSNAIMGYGTDVLSTEPMQSTNKLRGLPNVRITPHVAWSPKETRERLMDVIVQNFYAWLDGHPQNCVY